MSDFSNCPRGMRVAVIGLGRMGVRHLQAAANLRMTICGVSDISETARTSACRSHNLPPSACFDDALEMLQAARPDAVVVATTADSHASLVIAAAECGARYVLCEKPMATCLAEAETMTEACRRAGTLLAINHQMQFMPHYMRIKSLIGSDELGPLVSVLVAGSNFGLAMNGSHYFEMLRFVGESPVRSVRAWFEKDRLSNPRGRQFEDSSGRLLAQTSGDVSMYVDFSARAGHGLQLVFICRLGQIVVDELSGEIRIVARKSEFREMPTARYGMPSEVRFEHVDPTDTVSPTMNVWSALVGGRPFPDSMIGTHALACCVAAHVSNERGGEEVFVNSSLPHSRTFKWA
ncbi:Gfo/Idh/MocA family protein [Bradyrhizobium centrosematis]|uniref:Gfo/Idh/MocA family protein n=1 Tax=Bradyrhizobium centrosematis TaxID=1300039 RepID=UPI002169CF00|nr:Gfo/Idh/MocA family oxidoreductase [Bradyrhizobium centrosematis]MCS3765322.1 putative dehydrogenase [Bradyrhizobium centrosematis]MCS3773978.1 putative dehydrogenase [Bradyrhizobium centrosematis]